jgi:hypothetical protein
MGTRLTTWKRPLLSSAEQNCLASLLLASNIFRNAWLFATPVTPPALGVNDISVNPRMSLNRVNMPGMIPLSTSVAVVVGLLVADGARRWVHPRWPALIAGLVAAFSLGTQIPGIAHRCRW